MTSSRPSDERAEYSPSTELQPPSSLHTHFISTPWPASTLEIMPVSKAIMEQIKLLIPPLNGTLHKGQSGEYRCRALLC
jgi:hypothetical protein